MKYVQQHDKVWRDSMYASKAVNMRTRWGYVRENRDVERQQKEPLSMAS
jgi:hypothetical protein